MRGQEGYNSSDKKNCIRLLDSPGRNNVEKNAKEPKLVHFLFRAKMDQSSRHN